MKYCYPKLSSLDFWAFRLFGPGLGNLLFPWARATVLSKQMGLQLISPTWPQFKLGPWLRREQDARHYAGLFQDVPGALTSVRRVWALGTARRVPETQAHLVREGEVVEVSGMDGLFMPILAQHAQVRDALVQMTKSEHRAGLQCDFTNSVSLHVRLGDFAATPHQDDPHRPATNTRVPMHWYVDMLQGIRARQGRAVQAYIFSDGTDEELAPLLALDNCLRIGFGSAIADLLALSRAEILIASGSTFSMWASYLGRMPVIWPPGHKKQSLYGNSGVLEAELSTFG